MGSPKSHKSDSKKTKKHPKSKKTKSHKHGTSKAASNQNEHAKSKVTTMVSSIHEKYESINKNKNEFDHLATEANNDKGFEQIESRFQPLNAPVERFSIDECRLCLGSA